MTAASIPLLPPTEAPVVPADPHVAPSLDSVTDKVNYYVDSLILDPVGADDSGWGQGETACRQDEASYGGGYGVYFKFIRSTRGHFAPIQRIRTRSRSNTIYESASNSKTLLEVGAKYQGTAAGGYGYSRGTEEAWGLKWTRGTNVSGLERFEEWYHEYEVWCDTTNGAYYTGEYRVYPGGLAPGTQFLNNTNHFTCNEQLYAGNVDLKEAWSARESVITYAGWFSVAGISLSSNHTNTTSSRLTFERRDGYSYMRLCGWDGDWRSGHQVIEMP